MFYMLLSGVECVIIHISPDGRRMAVGQPADGRSQWTGGERVDGRQDRDDPGAGT